MNKKFAALLIPLIAFAVVCRPVRHLMAEVVRRKE
jgi:hypothetical protein